MKKSTKIVTVDSLARNVLSQKVENAFPNVDVGIEVKEAGVNISVDPIEVKFGKISVNFNLSGLQIAVALVIVGLGSIITQVLLSK